MTGDILIIDDEADIRELVSGILKDEGYSPRTAQDSQSAFRSIEKNIPALVLLDIWLEGSEMDGLELLDQLHSDFPNLPIIVISGHGNIEAAVSSIKRGAYDFVEKPFTSARLLMIARRAIEAGRLRKENETLRLRAGQNDVIVGDSAAITGMRAALERVAPTGSRVLISGPAGTGKEMAARLVHNRPKRAEGPFVVVNSARLAPDRIDIELFGVADGADESVGPARNGILEQADKGTLFIDEVADMPLETQGRILRVLQEQRFYRFGGDKEVHVDIRVVSATSRDLNIEIQAGRFREDLFHRLSVVPIKVPPLSDRREDIPALAKTFMEGAAQTIGLAPREISDDALAVLQAKAWSGNVRELRNLIERLLIMAPGLPGEPINAEMMPPEILADSSAALRQAGNGEIIAMPLREAREHFEREYLLAQISRFGGNISRTASFVGMERSALHRKLKSLGINSTMRG